MIDKLDIVVGADKQHANRPGGGWPDGTINPSVGDVYHKILKKRSYGGKAESFKRDPASELQIKYK